VARIEPFRAITFRHEAGADISDLVAPPYDVISPEQREILLGRSPHNAVALELPEGALDPTVEANRYETGARRWREWLAEGVLAEDDEPAYYVVEQSWERASGIHRRRVFVAAVELRPFADAVVLPHERTLPKALDDRLNLIRATSANLSQVFGMYSDPTRRGDVLLDSAMSAGPLRTATDDDGVTSRVWAIRDEAAIAVLTEMLADTQIFIADGHHRYTTALAHRDERRAAVAEDAGDMASDFVMMALANMDDPGLIVLPTHRLARAEGDFDPHAFWDALGEHFELAALGEKHPAETLAAAPRTAFVVRTSDGTLRLATLKADVDPAEIVKTAHSCAWKRLDVAILQELILDPLLGIHPDKPVTLERLSFVKDAHDALKSADADVAFVMNPTRMDQLREVALAGETMPQKSTYFYPKLLTGLLFRSLD
jgi:uncharacterized protein (DUF1015 family)